MDIWTKISSDMPYKAAPHCIDYEIDEQVDAQHCEFFVGGVGDAGMGHYGIPIHWIEAYVTVGSQDGELLGVGLLTRYDVPSEKTPRARFTFARRIDDKTWQTGFIRQKTAIMGSLGFDYAIKELAFFIDVRRPSGKVVRLWQSRHGTNYTWDDAFGHGTTRKSIPYGGINYADAGAPIFDAKRSCTK